MTLHVGQGFSLASPAWKAYATAAVRSPRDTEFCPWPLYCTVEVISQRHNTAMHVGCRRHACNCAYMHLSPATIERATRLLNQPVSGRERGEIVETADRRSVSALKKQRMAVRQGFEP